MAAKCYNVCLGHSGRKIAEKRGEGKGPTLAALCLANDEVSVKEKPGILIPVQVKTSIPAFDRDEPESRSCGGKRDNLTLCNARAREKRLKSKRADLS
jgi:hypothetical protein